MYRCSVNFKQLMLLRKMRSRFIFSKITNLPLKFTRKLSNTTNGNDVITKDEGDRGIIILNRPSVFNAINLSMAEKIYITLKKWESEKVLVIMKSTRGAAFSVGGDLRAMIESIFKGENEYEDIFKYQYIIKKLITSYKIPYVSFVDGLSMGSATSLSFLGQNCVVTESAIFSMPEVKIGFIPDGGSSYLLPKLQNHLGWYLALTGHRLKGTDIVKAGLTKYYCDSERLKYLEEDLLSNSTDKSINSILEKFNTNNIKDEFSLTPVLEKIDHCFSAKTLEEVIARLKADNSKWARETVKALNKNCPSSLKITFRELALGKELNMNECSQMEYRLAINRMKDKNFHKGVKALLIEKDSDPKWEPSSISAVSAESVESYFSSVPQESKLQSKL